MGCTVTCMMIGKAMDAVKGEDVPRAIQLLTDAYTVCMGSDCGGSIDVCPNIVIAINLLAQGDIEAAGLLLKEMMLYCDKIKG